MPSMVVALFSFVTAVSITGAGSKSFSISNSCNYTVWPGIWSGVGSAALDTTGFELAPGESRAIQVPSRWSGHLWGRTLCSTDAGTGKFACVTGDCGSGHHDCVGGNAAAPVTLAQFTMNGSTGMDSYDVSLVYGFNLPVTVAPYQGAAAVGNCAATGCVVDLNHACPPELRMTSATAAGGAVACKSACQAFGSPQYCCTGEYGDPNRCRPSAYSEFFKHRCPRAKSYAYDGAASISTCGGGGDTTYVITFCPISMTSNGKPSISTDSQSQPPVSTAASPPWVIIISLVTAVLGFVTTVWGVVKLLKTCSRQSAGN